MPVALLQGSRLPATRRHGKKGGGPSLRSPCSLRSSEGLTGSGEAGISLCRCRISCPSAGSRQVTRHSHLVFGWLRSAPGRPTPARANSARRPLSREARRNQAECVPLPNL
ncbi:hypothetical protein MTO96_017384 [Rhipicephalus appendiculatus]